MTQTLPTAMTQQVWEGIRTVADQRRVEPVLAPLHELVTGADDFAHALARLMAHKVADPLVQAEPLTELFRELLQADPSIVEHAAADLFASVERNPAYPTLLVPFLWAKGFVGLQVHRVAHRLWQDGRETMAFHLQSMVSQAMGLDIHPAARIGARVFIDHATGVVIGETAVVGEDTSILQGVTLGGTGKESGDRHPKVGRGVLLSAGANVLGNVRIGDFSRVGAGSVVLHEVPPYTTVVGVPARVVRWHQSDQPGVDMDQNCG